MCRFVQPRKSNTLPLSQIHERFYKFMEDDYNKDTLAGTIDKVYPFFWEVWTAENELAGFVYLDNITGNDKKFHSAEITTCIHPKYWGIFTKYCAKIFLKQCFDKFGFEKIKALVYPQNFRVKKLLNDSGFIKEAVLVNETKRNGKPQDIEIYSIFRNYYNKEKSNAN